jgi:hypothetical protein
VGRLEQAWNVLVCVWAAQMEIGVLFGNAAVNGDVGELRRLVVLGVDVNERGLERFAARRPMVI